MSPTSNSPHEQPTICLFLPTWIGDACMATPAITSLRCSYPDAKIVGVMRPPIADLLAGLSGADGQPLINEIVTFKKYHGKNAVRRLELALRLRKLRIDIGVLFTNSFWSAAIMKLAGARRTVGYARDARSWLLTDPLPVQREHKGKKPKPVPTLDYYLKLSDWLGGESSDRLMHLEVEESDKAAADDLWDQAGLDPNVPTVVMNNGSATDIGRVWAANRVAELAERVAVELEMQVLLHCGPGEHQSANMLANRVGNELVASMGVVDELPIGLSKAVLDRAALVVTTDSGPRHIAAAFNTPSIVLFGSTSPGSNRTYNSNETALEITSEDARTGVVKMQRITVDMVFDTVKEIAERSTAAA